MARRTHGVVLVLLIATPLVGEAQRPARQATFRVEATAYCVEGETASGEQTRRGIVAADPEVLPLGSRIRVDGLGWRLSRTYDVEDTGRLVKGRQIDIFMPDCGAAKAFGRQEARVRVVGLPPPESKAGTGG
jgi:3D (Asp-Asp-Asp) domain-containing protein